MSGISSGSDICIDKGKSCCAVGCMNRFAKGTPIHLYCFPDDPAREARWISAVNRKEWTLVKWPGRDELRKALPMQFRDDFQKYTVIIDFESFMNDPQT